MPIEVLMPALSPTMTEGTLSSWVKNEGDKVEPGDVIAEIETDKATMEVESVDEGVLGKILVPAGTEGVPVNQVIALLLEDGEDKGVLDGYKENESRVESRELGEGEEEKKEEVKKEEKMPPHASEKPKDSSAAPPPGGSEASVSGRVKASPLAKRLAKEYGVDVANVVGTGPKGRVVRADIEGFKTSGKSTENRAQSTAIAGRNPIESKEIPNSGMRKTIAKRLLEAKTTIPHFYLTVDCQMDKLLESRKELNAIGEEDGSFKLSVNDFIIKAVAMSLRKVPEANASWAEDATIQYNNVDVSVAVAIEGGLITPIVKNADQKTLSEISIEMKDLAGRAKEGKLQPSEYQGGGFSISNLGMYGIKEFSAIINPPQSCILAVGASNQQFVPDENGAPKIANVMSVTLSSDHRVVDGAVGAVFLKWFRQYIENPMSMFV